ncbi:MAG: antibiotic biosynthesis monooxygenase [Pseudomonadota bacterium]
MTTPAKTPPYYAVIFTSTRTGIDDGYADTASRMSELARTMDGFLGVESARDGLGITVSYWESEAAIRAWRDHPEHAKARRLGREKWYEAFTTRVCRVERAQDFCRAERDGNEG